MNIWLKAGLIVLALMVCLVAALELLNGGYMWLTYQEGEWRSVVVAYIQDTEWTRPRTVGHVAVVLAIYGFLTWLGASIIRQMS